MVNIPIGLGDWESESQDAPRVRMRNMYLTQNPLSGDGYSRVSRPTLKAFAVVGTGPIAGIWRLDSTFLGDWLVVSGTELYRITTAGVSTLLGAIPGSGVVEFAGTTDRAIIVRDGFAYSTDGLTVTRVIMPSEVPPHLGEALVQSVAMINGYFLFAIKDSQLFYWTEPGETNPDGLSFASAERIPDSIIAISVVSDEVWFLGETGPEVWTPTGQFEAPFQRVSGRVYAEGCVDRNTVVRTARDGQPGLVWVTNTATVVFTEGAPLRISNESVEELLRADSTNLRGWYYKHFRHSFYILTGNTFTVVYDFDTQTWSRWDTYGKTFWDAHLGCQNDSRVFCGSSVTNEVWQLEEGILDVALPVIREASGFIGHTGREASCTSVSVTVNAGWSPDYNMDPILELRWSDDLGATWSNYARASLGRRGVYRQDALYRSLGLLRTPGRTFELRFSEPARIRIDAVKMNEL